VADKYLVGGGGGVRRGRRPAPHQRPGRGGVGGHLRWNGSPGARDRRLLAAGVLAEGGGAPPHLTLLYASFFKEITSAYIENNKSSTDTTVCQVSLLR